MTVRIKQIKEMNTRIKRAFDVVKSELEDHREAINENTNELQSVYEFMYNLDAKVQKMNERLDEVQLMVTGSASETKEVSSLSTREKEVALVLYMEDEMQSIESIAKRTGLTHDLVKGYLKNITAKGVPITKSRSKNTDIFGLDESFKREQAKDNLLKINEAISQGLQY